MSEANPRVLIAGAGLSGLCLAQGLREAGVDVCVFERDTDPVARGQGYRLHIDQEGTAALRSCLPEALYDLTVATAGKRGSGVTVLSDTLETLHTIAFDAPAGPDDGSAGLTVDRLALRQILLAGLEDIVRFAAPYERFETFGDGGVRAIFSDGSAADGDLLVGADGARSRIRGQLLARASVVDTGQVLIFGKTPLTDEIRRIAPAPSLDGFSTVVGADGRFMPLAGLEFRIDPAAAAEVHWPALTFHDTRDYVMWVLGAPATALDVSPAQLSRTDGTGLRELAADRVSDWPAAVTEVVRAGDPDTVASTSVRTSQPVEHWRTGPVTLAGDAIHCMPPSGIGAGVALRDAGLLAQRLGEVKAGAKALLKAVNEYETEMLEYGFRAVAEAQRTLRAQTPAQS